MSHAKWHGYSAHSCLTGATFWITQWRPTSALDHWAEGCPSSLPGKVNQGSAWLSPTSQNMKRDKTRTGQPWASVYKQELPGFLLLSHSFSPSCAAAYFRCPNCMLGYADTLWSVCVGLMILLLITEITSYHLSYSHFVPKYRTLERLKGLPAADAVNWDSALLLVCHWLSSVNDYLHKLWKRQNP